MTVYLLILWFGYGNAMNSISIETKDLMTCESIAMKIKTETNPGFFTRSDKYASHKCIKIEK